MMRTGSMIDRYLAMRLAEERAEGGSPRQDDELKEMAGDDLPVIERADGKPQFITVHGKVIPIGAKDHEHAKAVHAALEEAGFKHKGGESTPDSGYDTHLWTSEHDGSKMADVLKGVGGALGGAGYTRLGVVEHNAGSVTTYAHPNGSHATVVTSYPQGTATLPHAVSVQVSHPASSGVETR